MTPQEYQQQKQILEQALDLPEAEQKAFIQQACPDDTAMQQRLLDMIVDEDSYTEFLETPGIDLKINQLNIEPISSVPDEFKQYKIIEEIGSGGMGKVYAAQQHFPADRQVAIKVLKHISNQQQLIDETQAQVKLHHPNIATLFEIDRLEDGRMYIVMELVEGTDLISWSKQHHDSTREKLMLFSQVCAGISHAHEKGIVHCDIKPSNILVTRVNDRAIVKIIDFGIAQFQEDLIDQEKLAGTMGYLCPEALEAATAREVDTRRDVYALGMLLHKQLCGHLPHKHTPDQSLPKDLQAIISKATAQDREQRYPSPLEISNDINRYLTKRVVRARKSNVFYSLQRFVQRRLGSVLFVTALILSLVGGFIAQAKQARIAREQALLAEQQAEVAKVAQQEAEELSGFLLSIFDAANPDSRKEDRLTVDELLENAANKLLEAENPTASQARFMQTVGSIYTRMDMLESAQTFIEKALQAHDEQEISADVVDLMTELGLIHRKLRNNEEAEKQLTAAAKLLEQMENPDMEKRALIQNHLGNLAWQKKNYAIAASHHKQAIDYRLRSDNPNAAADSYNNLGVIYLEQKQWHESARYFEEAKRIYTEVFDEEYIYVALVKMNLAIIKYNTFQWQASEDYMDQSMATFLKQYGAEHGFVLRSHHNYGRLYELQFRFEDAAARWLTLIGIHEKNNNHDQHIRYRSQLAYNYRNSGKLDQALEQDRLALRIYHENKLNKPTRYAITLLSYATSLREKGALELADKQLDEGVLALQQNHAQHYMTQRLLRAKAQIAEQQEQPETAEEFLLQVINQTFEDKYFNKLQTADAHKELGQHYYQQGQFTQSLEHLELATAMQLELRGEQNLDYSQTLFALVKTQLALGDTSQATKLLQEAETIQTMALPSDHEDLLATQELRRSIE